MEKEPVVVYMEKQEKNGNVMEKAYGDSEVASVGERIKTLRIVRQLSRKQLAERASVPYGTIYTYEQYNRTPSRKILVKIANALSVSMEFFEDEFMIPSEFGSMKFYMEVVKKYVLPCNDYNDADGRYIYADKFYNRKSSSSGASVGDKIKALRIVRGLKQVQLAEKVVALRASISAYEKNKSMPPRERLEKISDVLSVSMAFFEDEFAIPSDFDSTRFYTEVVKKYALSA